jgi:hypothetical protein
MFLVLSLQLDLSNGTSLLKCTFSFLKKKIPFIFLGGYNKITHFGDHGTFCHPWFHGFRRPICRRTEEVNHDPPIKFCFLGKRITYIVNRPYSSPSLAPMTLCHNKPYILHGKLGILSHQQIELIVIWLALSCSFLKKKTWTACCSEMQGSRDSLSKDLYRLWASSGQWQSRRLKIDLFLVVAKQCRQEPRDISCTLFSCFHQTIAILTGIQFPEDLSLDQLASTKPQQTLWHIKDHRWRNPSGYINQCIWINLIHVNLFPFAKMTEKVQ